MSREQVTGAEQLDASSGYEGLPRNVDLSARRQLQTFTEYVAQLATKNVKS